MKDRPTYAVTAGRKAAIEPANGSEDSGCSARNKNPPQPHGAPAEPVTFVCRNMTMAAFAQTLSANRAMSGYLFNYPVLDRAGLKGTWNFSFKYSPRQALVQTPVTPETITIFDALEKQLGLKLNLKMSTPAVVVDTVNEKPTANPPGVTEKLSPHVQFEVANIKPDADMLEGSSVKIDRSGAVRINMSLKGLIQEAWANCVPIGSLADPNRWTQGAG